MKRSSTQTAELEIPCRLTNDELEEESIKLTTLITEKAMLEARKKATVKDFNAAHRLAPNLWTFRKWYKDAMTRKKDQQTEEAAETAPEAEETAAETEAAEAAEEIPEEGSAEPEAEEVPDEVLAQDEEAIQPPDDYTKRLELVCRMYRTHSEESRDDLCDYLLPDLCRAAEE